MPPTAKPKAQAAPKTNNKYGIEWPDHANALSIELACYRDRSLNTGQTREFHLRNAFKICWPDYQWNEWCDLITWAWCNFRFITVIGHTRASKCLGKGTPVMLYDGRIIPVEDVQVGMQLMGDDSTPRNVLSLARGREEMFRIDSTNSGSWTCNRSHILTLKASTTHNLKRDGIKDGWIKGEVRDVPLEYFLKQRTAWKAGWKQFQVPVIFPAAQRKPEFDPYIYGCWIADGGRDLPLLHKPDGPMVRRWVSYWESMGATVTKRAYREGDCPAWYVGFAEHYKNPLKQFVKTSFINEEKRILHHYLVASYDERMALLAGLLDGDGCASKSSFCIVTKYKGLANDIQFLARSLGFYASQTEITGKIASTGFEGKYQSVYISGDCWKIPTLQKRQKRERRGLSNPVLGKITPVSIGEGDYYGFEIDGNHRFLLGDFTVTHNTYHSAHLALIHFMAGDIQTSVTLTTTQFAALKTRLWGDMLKAIESLNPPVKKAFMMRYKLTNSTNEMRLSITDPGVVGLDKYIIQGVATDRGDTAAGKLRGLNTERRVIIGDEASDIADSIFLALIHGDGSPDFIGLLLTNPVEKVSELGNHCCPEGGWGSITDSTLWWKTKRSNGVCLHFDGLQSPNVRAGKVVFPYLITQDYIDKMRKDEGEGSLKWWMLVRGFFPPDGLVAKIWTSGDIEKAKANVEFDYEPTPCATLDPAFESDDCVIHFGEIGRLRDSRPCCRATSSETLKLTVGPNEIPKDYQVARQVMDKCKARGILPENFIMDETGNARGVLAILRMEWSPKVQGICYGGEATERPIRINDSIKACDQVRYFVSELWFRAAYLARDGLLCGLNNVDPKTEIDLSVRRYEMKNGLMVAHSKILVKEVLGRSPDNGDAFCQFGELMVRKGLIGAISSSAPNKMWDQMKKLAKKANARFSETREFANHGAS